MPSSAVSPPVAPPGSTRCGRSCWPERRRRPWLLAFKQIADPALSAALARHPQDGGGAGDQKPVKISIAHFADADWADAQASIPMRQAPID